MQQLDASEEVLRRLRDLPQELQRRVGTMAVSRGPHRMVLETTAHG